MYNDVIFTYDKLGFNSQEFIDFAGDIGITITTNFIEEKIFFGCDGDYKNSDYGTGKVYIFYTADEDEFILISTYLSPYDQIDLLRIGVHYHNKRTELIENLWHCFNEEDSLFPYEEGTLIVDDNRLTTIAQYDSTSLSALYKEAIPSPSIEIIKITPND